MNDDRFQNLKPYKQREFLERNARLKELSEIEPYYNQLINRPIENANDFKKWLEDRSELESAVDQVRTILYIKMTCQTDDDKKAEAYKNYVEKVSPRLKILSQDLDMKFLKGVLSFPDESYSLLSLKKKNQVELFREANVSLQTSEALLSQEYQSLCASMTVEFEGKEQTMQMMQKYLHVTDRAVREKAWRSITERRFKEKEKFDLIFEKMLDLRQKIATNAGFKNFMEYQFRAYNRFDYTPADCRAFHDAVSENVVPLLKRIHSERKKDLKLDSLRPWDIDVDTQGKPPLKPFQTMQEFVRGIQGIFNKIDPKLGSFFEEMNAIQVLDLESRKGKAPGAYQSTLSEARKPFVFMNAVGIDSDVRTLLHESGHAFHAILEASIPLIDYRDPPIEFCEVASMSMELIGSGYFDVFYNEEDSRRAKKDILEEILYIIPWIATIDSFQHWIYTHPGHSREDRAQVWLEIREKFGGGVIDWNGLKEAHENLWHRQLHIFEYPFYYIEYGIAQLGALSLWVNFKKAPREAIRLYQSALSLGGSRPLPDLFKAAGLKFDFSAKAIKPLMQEIEKELEKL